MAPIHSAHPFLCRALALAGLLAVGVVTPAAAQDREEAIPPPPLSAATGGSGELVKVVLDRAKALPRLRTVIVAREGRVLVERAFKGDDLDAPANVKSVAKAVISALVGAALDRNVLESVDQTIAPILSDRLPSDPDPRLRTLTIEHLLTMRAGLERTSGANYGRWVSSPNWVRFALSRPFVAEPGGRMLYSTGNSHLLSAILTEAAERSTLELAREWLGKPLEITIPPWTRDPQGIYLGGNDMGLSPRALLRFGEMYRNRGVFEGRRVLPESWIEASWTPKTASPHSGHQYGYGWFIAEMAGHPVYYAWGYGGQMLYVVPSLALTAVMTSDTEEPAGRSGYVRELHALLEEGIIPMVQGHGNGSP